MVSLRVALACCFLAHSLVAQQPETPPVPRVTDLSFAPGTLTERVASSINRVQHYAVFLPSSWRRDRPAPVLLLMDPRGRALTPMRLVRERAERYGWVVLSSWNTLSDWDNQPNVDAMSAMLTDLQRIFLPDASRLYLAGFSGTARFAWEEGLAMRGHVAGVIGVGAGVPPGFNYAPQGVTGPFPFDFFGTVGSRDFNYEELLTLEGELTRRGIVHRVRYHDGPHAWPPRGVMEEALDWFEVRAVARQQAPARQPWLDSLFAEDLGRGAAQAAAGDTLGALKQYRAVAADFAGVRDVSAPAARADSLGRTRAAKEAIKKETRILAENRAYLRKLVDFLRRYHSARALPSLEQNLKTLEITRLLAAEKDTRDTISALAASRLLSHVMAAAGFYEPRDYLVAGDSARAMGMLRIAGAVRPGPNRDPDAVFRALVEQVRQGHP